MTYTHHKKKGASPINGAWFGQWNVKLMDLGQMDFKPLNFPQQLVVESIDYDHNIDGKIEIITIWPLKSWRSNIAIFPSLMLLLELDLKVDSYLQYVLSFELELVFWFIKENIYAIVIEDTHQYQINPDFHGNCIQIEPDKNIDVMIQEWSKFKWQFLRYPWK